MSVRRLSAGLMAAALLTPGVAACTATGDGTAGPTATPSGSATATATGAASDADAKQALLDSTREISNGNFRFRMSGAGSTAEGQVHQPSQSAQLRVSIGEPDDDLAMSLDLIHAKPDSWVKLDLSGAAAESIPGRDKLNLGKYQHLDQSRIQGNRNLGFDFDQVDPAGSDLLTQAVTEVRRTGDGAYAGTIDVSKAAEAGSLDQTLITALGAQANSVPFTATTDAQGRLTELVLQLPAAGETAAQEVRITYTDYGNATAAEAPPADQVVEAPAELYNLFD
ncbi:hypothetical protein [Micromonospora endophytica]|uniref:Uncharacterized protein n=1 Tax=Micromonospora endophytica TaxID=515350 RepID=A0A2W2CSC4_9ACTN|nr:hypothetical protein [Micromonospora endophytica]PZF91259.1 hypothetical protein C1I93_21680 [Micromonospora endophytica]RIW45426.1 hypothetical protein D3H59_15190 [Micromonospora endophytica]BCJ58564.1 hypothetical protein Jiend_19860 [Micromonospora endophytica]